jgi:hypothetical protein
MLNRNRKLQILEKLASGSKLPLALRKAIGARGVSRLKGGMSPGALKKWPLFSSEERELLRNFAGSKERSKLFFGEAKEGAKAKLKRPIDAVDDRIKQRNMKYTRENMQNYRGHAIQDRKLNQKLRSEYKPSAHIGKPAEEASLRQLIDKVRTGA